MSKNLVNTTTIRNLLTIRYDPTEQNLIPLATTLNFQNKTSDLLGAKTENLLKKFIKHSLQNYDTISISLSGGIDSSLLAGLIRQVFPNKKIIGICGVFKESFDESKIAQKISKQFDIKFKIVHMKSIFSEMPTLISISSKPTWNTYNHLIIKEAKKFSSIIINGDGADEIFAGYTFRYSKFLNLNKSNFVWETRVKKYLECHNRDWVIEQNQIFGKSIKFNWRSIYQYFKKYFNNSLNHLEQVMLSDFNGKLLYDFIPTSKTICKFHSIKGVSPFLNSNIIKFGLALPLHEKYNYKNNKGKLVLREISKRLKINHLDEKKGFSPSLWHDWNQNGKKICENILFENENYIFKKKLINPNWLLQAIEQINDDGDIRTLYRVTSILALELWLQKIYKNK